MVDLTEVDDGEDLNDSIPEIPPEPVSLFLALVEVDETAGSTTGGHDMPPHTGDPEIPPEPLSIAVELTEYDDVSESWNESPPEVPPDPVSFSVDLAGAPM